jgi:hypothetical protein
MRRIDRLPIPILAGTALDVAGMGVFLLAPETIGWPLGLVLVAAASRLIAMGLPAAGLGNGALARWMRRLAVLALAMALLVAIAGALDVAIAVVGPVALATVGLLHGVVWAGLLPWARPLEGLETFAALVHIVVATLVYFCIPLASQIARDHVDAVALVTVVTAYVWSLYLLAPRATVADVARPLARLASAATWAALGLVTAPIAHIGGPALVRLWILAAILAAALTAAGLGRRLPAAALAAVGLAALLIADRDATAIPEGAVVAAAAVAWLAIAAYTGVRAVDIVAIAGGAGLAALSPAHLTSAALPAALTDGDAVTAAIAATSSILRAAYLAAVAARAMHGADRAQIPVPRAVLRRT